MPDRVPGWFNHVRSPLALTDGEMTTVLALNGEAQRLFATVATLPCALAALIGGEAAATIAGMRSADPDPPPRTLACHVAGRGRTLDIAVSRLEDGRHLVTIVDRMAELEVVDKLSAMQDDIHEIMEALPVGIEIYDSRDECLFVNSHGAALFGYAVDELLNLEDWWPRAYPDPSYRQMAIEAWESGIRDSRASMEHVHMADWIVTCKDGTQKLIHFRLRSLGDNIVLVYWDVTAQGRLVKQLRHLADTDDLTGISNRRRFLTEAESVLREARETGMPVALLMIDLDYFKAVNDRFGHATGDLVLRGFVDRCRRALREQDLFARLGGEEFAALLQGTGEAEAYRLAETLRHFIAVTPIFVEGVPIKVTVSIGLSVLDPREPHADAFGEGTPEAELSRLLRRADRALYAAKHGGRNQVVRADAILADEAS